MSSAMNVLALSFGVFLCCGQSFHPASLDLPTAHFPLASEITFTYQSHLFYICVGDLAKEKPGMMLFRVCFASITCESLKNCRYLCSSETSPRTCCESLLLGYFVGDLVGQKIGVWLACFSFCSAPDALLMIPYHIRAFKLSCPFPRSSSRRLGQAGHRWFLCHHLDFCLAQLCHISFRPPNH
jgi:hypothetical protein